MPQVYPQQSTNPPKEKDEAIKSPSVPTPQADVHSMRDDWNKMPTGEQDKLLNSMNEDEQAEFASRLGIYGSGTNHTLSAPLKTGSIPWMKSKAYSLLTAGANQLPTVMGALGGMFGGGVGEGLNPAGGGIPGAIIGSGIGGGVGEAARQGIYHTEGLDKYDEKSPKTWGERFKEMGKEGAGQAAGEASGQLLGKWMRPTLERSLAKLAYAGNINHGKPLGEGDLDKVINDLIATEKQHGKATTVGDFIGVINQTKKDIGQEVDIAMSQPIMQNGKKVMLGKAEADSTPIVNAVNSLLTADPSITKEAALNKAGKEASYLATIKKEALKFQQHPWSFEELTSKRIRLNQELAPLYEMSAGDARVYLLEHPDLAIKKAQAEAIRDIIYPQMDRAAGYPLGTTARLQEKRGTLMSLENQVTEHLGKLKTKARQAKGAPSLEKVNISSYGTTGGKPGLAVHRLTGLVHTPNPERAADSQVKKAFGHGFGPNARRIVNTPFGSEKLGNEFLSLPLREIVNPSQPKKPEDQESTGPQSSVARPKELIERAKQLNPSAQGQVAYSHIAVNPENHHRIGSNDGKTWFDVSNGQQVA